MAPLRVTVPAVVLSTPTPAEPLNIAVMAPARRSKLLALLSTPVLPVMLPVRNCTAATLSLKVPRAKLPPSTTTLLNDDSALLMPSASVPVCTFVVPR